MRLQRPSGSAFATRGWNRSKWTPQKLLGALLPPEAGTPQNEPPEAIREPFCHQSPKQLQTMLQRQSGSLFVTRAQNSSKWASRGHLGALLPPDSRTTQNEPPEAIWEPFCHQSWELLKMSLQKSEVAFYEVFLTYWGSEVLLYGVFLIYWSPAVSFYYVFLTYWSSEVSFYEVFLTYCSS